MAAAKGLISPPSRPIKDLDNLENEFESLLLDIPRQCRGKVAAVPAVAAEREVDRTRSGSAPLSVEGARNSVGSLLGDFDAVDMIGYSKGPPVSGEDMRSHPAYLSSYCANGSTNPRLPPPTVSEADLRAAQRFQAGAFAYGKISEGTFDGNCSSLFTVQPDFHRAEPTIVSESSCDPFNGLPGNGIGIKNRSFADVLQANLRQSKSEASPGSSASQSFAHEVQAFGKSSSMHLPSDLSLAKNRSIDRDRKHFINNVHNNFNNFLEQNIVIPAAEERDLFKYASANSSRNRTASSFLSTQRVPSSMNGHIYGVECMNGYDLHSDLFSERKPFLDVPLNGRQYVSSGFLSHVRQNDMKISRVSRGDRSYSSLLEEFKNSSKSRNLQLSDVVGHAVDFSVDQYGSRFIQQKLETASFEEKNKIFPEILLHARVLATDVFGNYVIQKFLEHGSEIQRKQLACQLAGHVLTLSLQMYGCRVIQKALEVIDADQQAQLVSELDGSVMKCVCDQNGNHVIQKCIERVPPERIQHIISALHGQVVPLSVHPYGCRVIQRVLEHFSDETTESFVMDEILRSACSLAEDQYGNYVVQHVLQHGGQKERSAVIGKLAGKMAALSRQKFASNVVEKCLTFGTSEERQLMVDEMLGSIEGDESPLLAMMKDQFGNYVVQKALETCDEKSREVILSRIKAYVGSQKKHAYAKHVSARIEKVIAAGERHMRAPSS